MRGAMDLSPLRSAMPITATARYGNRPYSLPFPTSEAAGEWVSQNYPTIDISGSVVRIELSKTAFTSESADWICVQVKDSAPTTEVGILATPCPLLLLRGSDLQTTEETLYQGLNAVVPIQGVRLVKDRISHMSYGFAFAEFGSLDAANYLLGVIFNSVDPRPLVIDNRTVVVSYAHLSSFMPVYVASPWVSTSFADANGRMIQVSYWDQNAYAIQYPSSATATTFSSAPAVVSLPLSESATVMRAPQNLGVLGDELKAFYSNTEKDHPEADASVSQAAEDIPSVLEDGEVGHSLDVATHPEVAGSASTTTLATVVDLSSEAPSAPPTVASHEGMAGSVAPLSSLPAPKKTKKTGAGTGSRISIQLQKWQNKQAELKDFDVVEFDRERDGHVDSVTEEALMMRLPSDSAVNDEHSDLSIMACLLCQRQFKSADDLRKHQIKSALHKTNLQSLRQKQLEKLREQIQSDQAASKKRRKQQQWNTKSGFNAVSALSHGQTAGATPAVVSSSTRTEIGEDNIGNRMLQKMGWKAGQGLGAGGEGIVAPVEAKAYAAGAGIGASAALTMADLSEMNANGRDPNTYSERMRRAARHRLANMAE
ncbi:hypothetical protein BSLG_009847 [Batrachochytrium salamandrivorans]|nr:hypothetical protein BSLG_009847 [Batrachochytrium salamandrivorans]